MTVELDAIETAADAAREEAPPVRGRMRVAPPPLVPDTPAPPRRPLARPALVAAMLALAGIAHLTGSSLIVTGALAAIGLVTLVMQVTDLREERRLASVLDENTSRSREQIEHPGGTASTSHPGMIGGLIGRPVACSTGPGSPTPIPASSSGRRPVSEMSRLP